MTLQQVVQCTERTPALEKKYKHPDEVMSPSCVHRLGMAEICSGPAYP